MDKTSIVVTDVEHLHPDIRKALEYKLNDIEKNANVKSAKFKFANLTSQLAMIVVTDNEDVQHHTAYYFGSLEFEYDMFATKE